MNPPVFGFGAGNSTKQPRKGHFSVPVVALVLRWCWSLILVKVNINLSNIIINLANQINRPELLRRLLGCIEKPISMFLYGRNIFVVTSTHCLIFACNSWKHFTANLEYILPTLKYIHNIKLWDLLGFLIKIIACEKFSRTR